MTPCECADAARALSRWFESQELSPAEAVPVLVATLTVIISANAQNREEAADKLARVVMTLAQGVGAITPE